MHPFASKLIEESMQQSTKLIYEIDNDLERARYCLGGEMLEAYQAELEKCMDQMAQVRNHLQHFTVK